LFAVNPKVIQICEAVRDVGGRAMLVGGCVRDRLLGVESKDFDIEVFGVAPEMLWRVLKRVSRVNTVGEQFAVYKLILMDENLENRVEIDVSLPRRESKSGRGHRGFVIEGDPSMTFEDAARRRDFTINAILLDPLTDEIVDPFHGARDLQNRVLRVVSADTFTDDSLRVLRAVQLAARFDLQIEEQTANLCRTIDLSDLPRERVWGEFEKLLTMATKPSIGIDAAYRLGVFEKLVPELQSMALHNDAFESTKSAMDRAAELSNGMGKPQRIAVMLATLLFQVSPPDRLCSLFDRFGVQTIYGYDVRSAVMSILRERTAPDQLYQARSTDGDIRRLSKRVEIDLLVRVAKAWQLAANNGGTAEDWLIDRARSLGVAHKHPAPVLMGRHLLELGIAPGPQIGELLRQVYEFQLDGLVTNEEEGLAIARRLLQKIPVDSK
jgi:tRNA nucleotidyltransferase (CCA-adding enzyme)